MMSSWRCFGGSCSQRGSASSGPVGGIAPWGETLRPVGRFIRYLLRLALNDMDHSSQLEEGRRVGPEPRCGGRSGRRWRRCFDEDGPGKGDTGVGLVIQFDDPLTPVGRAGLTDDADGPAGQRMVWMNDADISGGCVHLGGILLRTTQPSWPTRVGIVLLVFPIPGRRRRASKGMLMGFGSRPIRGKDGQ